MQPWQSSLKSAFTEYVTLMEYLGLDLDRASVDLATKQFPLMVPREFACRIEKGNPNDPLLLQVLPQAREMTEQAGYSKNPLKENQFNPVPGLLHKYPGRVLLTTVGACAVNCRFCFRRHFPYQDNLPSQNDWRQVLEYIAKDSSIEEVILSGGDPLVLKDEQLSDFVKQLEKIPHVERLRFHTRFPIMIPSRINSQMLDWISATRLQVIMVLHCNHPNEIDEQVREAFQKLRDHHVTLLNQSVLLKNINDNPDTLIALNKKLFAAHVQPYYLHCLDKVDGSAHFEVSLNEALKIMKTLQEKLSGYLVPNLVREDPGELHKTRLF